MLSGTCTCISVRLVRPFFALCILEIFIRIVNWNLMLKCAMNCFQEKAAKKEKAAVDGAFFR